MLVFGRNLEHILSRWRERSGLDEEKFFEILSHINAYLPPDWRMTKSKNNFFIQIHAEKQVVLAGRSFKIDDDETIISLINTVLSCGQSDKFEPEAGEKTPNIYYFSPSPENFHTPLFARQYEKEKKTEKGGWSRYEYHRIHPLTKIGLDIEHFLWVRWDSKTGEVKAVENPPSDFHGKDYWELETLISNRKNKILEYFRKTTEDRIKHPAQLPSKYKSPYETEYKFILTKPFGDRDKVVNEIKDYIQNNNTGFKIVSITKPEIQEDIYFDDDKFYLHSLSTSFRVRLKEKDNIRITLKKREPQITRYSPQGLYKRVEEEAVIPARDLEKLQRKEPINALPYRILSYIAPILDYRTFSEKLRVVNERTKFILENTSKQRVDISLDLVAYKTDKHEEPFFELEIESKGAPQEQIEKRLVRPLQEKLHCVISELTKYERGITILKRKGYQKDEEKKMVIIDTDCGVDDALALIIALKSQELDVKAITTVSGNVPEKRVFENVWKVLKYGINLGKQTPIVARGAREPLVRELRVAKSVHGEDGLGDAYPVPDPNYMKCDSRPAWQVICDLAEQYPKKITIITIGPMTNLALAVKFNREACRKLKAVVAMGGVFKEVGNVGADAEFNIGVDPDGARIVTDFCISTCLKLPFWKDNNQIVELPREPNEEDYQRAIDEHFGKNSSRKGENTIWDWHQLVTYKETEDGVPLTFIGLDVTHRVVLREAFIESTLRSHPGHQILEFVSKITRKYMEFYKRNERLPGCYIHDTLAVGYVINPFFLEVKKHAVQVETKGEFTTGVIFPDDRPTINPVWKNPAKEVIGIATDVNEEAFEEWFMFRLIE